MLTRTRFYTTLYPWVLKDRKLYQKDQGISSLTMNALVFVSSAFFHFFHASNFRSKLCKRSPIRSSAQNERKFNFCTFQWSSISLSWCSQNRGNLCANHKTVSAAMHQEPSVSSTNVAAVPQPNGHVSCELLSIDNYNASENFVRSFTSHHYSIMWKV